MSFPTLPKLSFLELAAKVSGELLNAPKSDLEIKSVASDSKVVTPGALFFAIEGGKIDGHDYLEEAFSRGAIAAVLTNTKKFSGRWPGIVVPDSRRALSRAAALFYGEPSRTLKVVGLTGTNGKTTTNWLIYHLLRDLGCETLRIGTLGAECGTRFVEEGNLTTPDPLTLQRLFYRAQTVGAKAVVMEVSSHALAQSRVDEIEFDVGVFTNLSRDHLDYHKDFEDYFEAKAKLFELLSRTTKTTKAAIINADDSYGKKLIDRCRTLGLKTISFGQSATELEIKSFSQKLSGSELQLEFNGNDISITSSLIGLHNAQNLTCAFGAGVALGFEPRRVAEALGRVPQVPGRLQALGDENRGIWVDYAHTPDALENVLKALRPLVPGKLWVVFGCGGDRDKGKRPQMAELAAKYGDLVVVTSDNPRTEDPNQIIADILSSGVKPFIVEADRAKAIHQAVRGSGRGDGLLIAGKGHEDYQIIGTEKIHLSDVEEVLKVIGP